MSQETLPGLAEREILESMNSEQLVTYILSLGEQVTDLERKMNLASNVLEGVHGLTVEDVLSK